MLIRPSRSGLVSRARQAGLSIVEMMVGITVGLFVVAAATVVVTSQLGDNRLLLLETQLQQDLRASADIVTREVRRASAWGAASQSVWYPGSPSAAALNPFGEILAGEEGTGIEFEYQRGAGAEGPYGFRLTETGVIQTQLAGAGWQDLTDGRVMRVTRFDVALAETPSEPLPCPRLCDDGTADCWPLLVMRSVRIDIEAESRADANIRRTISTVVRPRNDEVRSRNGASVCP